jgi:transposase
VLNLTSAALKVFLALDPCDMRKSFNGLHTLASDQLHAAPARDALFVFTNKRRNRIKLLYFDGTGLWVAAKRLEKGRFSWPAPSEPGQRRISSPPKRCNSSSTASTSAEPPSNLGMSARTNVKIKNVSP